MRQDILESLNDGLDRFVGNQTIQLSSKFLLGTYNVAGSL